MKPRTLFLFLGLLLLPVLVVGLSIGSLRAWPVEAVPAQEAIILPCGHKVSSHMFGGGEDFFRCAYGHKFEREDGVFYAVAR
jgi:hypothetical protein